MSNGPLPTLTPLNQVYWEGTAKRELRVRHCRACDARFRFVRSMCPVCWSEDLDWQVVSGRGKVVACTIVTSAPYESVADRVPYVLALIHLAEGPTMMANVVECAPEAVHVGMAVDLTFEARGEFTLPQFRPAK